MTPALFDRIIETVLRDLDPVIPYSEAAHRLLLGTAAHESGLFRWIDQKTAAPVDAPGPAFGYFQMEIPTHDDMLRRIAGRPALVAALRRWRGMPEPGPGLAAATRLYNPFYAAAAARAYYWLAPPALPEAGDVVALAAYYKRWWNTPAGAASPQDFIDGLAAAERMINEDTEAMA